MKKFWVAFFIFWPTVAVVLCWMAPAMDWWFPDTNGPTEGVAQSPLGREIDDLFYLILIITSVTFIGVQIALGYVLWQGASRTDREDEKAVFSHGSHNLEVIWTIVPAGILLFIALYQMDVWARYRVKSNFPEEVVEENPPVAEVTARQFEWRIRYPDPDYNFFKTVREHGEEQRVLDQRRVEAWLKTPQPGDLYAVNDLHIPTNEPIMIYLRTDDVQHSFFVPHLRVKQDAVPKQIIPIWFEADREGNYDLTCAELCGWGHYKMKGRVTAQPQIEFGNYLDRLRTDQNYDGVEPPAAGEVASN